ncbi:MAG TPA: polyprenyl synthetase family protein [Planctomycetota bacterium]|nr:polyprenyl synthetase family protein [Planctomycetota bacterium]
MTPEAAPSLDALYRDIAPDLATVDAEIAAALAVDRPELKAMMAHAAAYAGKKLRPGLVLLIGKAMGGDPRLRRLGACVELIHLATLVHDDVIDGAERRRKIETVNARWTNYDAVLLGDVIFSRAINLLGRLGDARSIDVLTRAASTLCEGEILQNAHRHDADLEENLYYRIISDKTAVLYGAACELAAHLSRAPEPVVQGLKVYGVELGLAFQIIDDCLDLVGDESEVGKSLGTDLRNGKVTLPILLLFRRVDAAERKRLAAAVIGGAEESERRRLLEALRAHGSVEEALERAARHVRDGLAAARAVAPAGAMTALETVAAFVVARRK